uniref:Mitochondrial carrier homolog 2 n=1 Tax=Schistocephalus solidus TaxID=70667 RepID=A0A0X3NG57_SCHSO
MTQICGNSWVQFSYDYGIPTALSIAGHPLVTARTLMMLGFEYEPPVRCKTIFGGERYFLPNVFRYLGYLREDIGVFRIFSTGLTASIIGSNIKSVACDAYLKRNVVNYYNKKSVIDTNNGPKVFAQETSKLMVARCLGIIASYPFQVVMVRQIGQIVGKENIYSNLINALIDINFEEGLPGLFRYVSFPPFLASFEFQRPFAPVTR